MGKSPSFMFYPGDWLRNDVSGCSLEAQGLWLRMMMIMHDAQIYGQLVLNNEQMPPEFVAKKVGISPKKYLNLLKELEFAGVINRKENGIIYSGRMERDEAVRQQNRARQEKHRSGDDAENNASVTPEITPDVTDSSRKSHAALHSSSSSSSSEERKEDKGEELRVETPQAAPTKKGARIAEPFILTAEMKQYAAEKRPDVDPILETEKFVNYWRAKTGKDATKLDWTATWRNWILNARASGNGNGTPKTFRQQRNDEAKREGEFVENLRRAVEGISGNDDANSDRLFLTGIPNADA